MKVIDCTPKTASESFLQQILAKIEEKLPFLGASGAQVHQAILERFQRGLDNRFTMVENFTPEGQSKPVPFILVGPHGITVLNLNSEKGIYRAKEENWLEMNKSTRHYAMARVNLIKQTQAMAQAVSDYLSQQGQFVPEVTPVLIFSDPGVHIDANRPAIRLVLADGIDRLVSSFLQGADVLKPVAIKGIIDLFDRIAHPIAPVPVREDDFFGKDLGLTEKSKTSHPRHPAQVKMPSFLSNNRFTRSQWILLAFMLVLNILLLMGVIMLVVITAG